MPRVRTKKKSIEFTRPCDWCDKHGNMGGMARAIVPEGKDLWIHDACVVKMMELKPVEKAWFCSWCNTMLPNGPGQCSAKGCSYVTASYKTECYRAIK